MKQKEAIHQATAEKLRKHRKTLRESQDRFWARFGVTQSRGSRFEKGAEIPMPVLILLGLYFRGVVTDGDLRQVWLQHQSLSDAALNEGNATG